MKAALVHWHKARVQGHFVLELKIHRLEKSEKYPDGTKYSLICKDLRTGRKVLMDNHHPKGHHVHLDDKETSYEFTGNDALLKDFEAFVLHHLGVKL